MTGSLLRRAHPSTGSGWRTIGSGLPLRVSFQMLAHLVMKGWARLRSWSRVDSSAKGGQVASLRVTGRPSVGSFQVVAVAGVDLQLVADVDK